MPLPEMLLNLLIASAHAADAVPAAPGGVAGFLQSPYIFIVFIAILYFIMIRPQQKRAKEHRNLVSALVKGDEVMTNSGIYGRVTDLDETMLTLEVAQGVAIKVNRNFVDKVLPKGTLKSL